MRDLVISENSTAEDLLPLAIAVNELVRLPVTMRSKNHPGVRVEKGKAVDEAYTGPVLEGVLASGEPSRTVPQSGTYEGVPVAVSPIIIDGRAVAAIGVVDLVGTIDIPEVFGAYAEVIEQVSKGR